MKIFKKILDYCFMAVLILSIVTSTAYATTLAGDDVVYCNVSIAIADESGGYSGAGFKVTFKDVTGTASQEVTVNSSNWNDGNSISVSLPAPTTYNITFDGLESGYQINDKDTDKLAETVFPVSEGSKEFHWVIVNTGNVISAPVVDTTGDTPTDKPADEKEAVYKEFVDAVSFIANEPTWSGAGGCLSQYGEGTANGYTFANYYAKYVEDGTVEEYYAMSPLEQFLWTESYTRLAEAVNSGWGYDHFFGNDYNFKQNLTNIAAGLMYGKNNDVVKDAYIKLMDWQYNYIRENGVPYNFINDRSYIDEMGSAPVVEEKEDLTDEEEIEQIRNELLNEEVTNEPEEKRNVWSDTMDMIAQKALLLAVAFILLAILGIVKYIHRTKNIKY